MQKLGNKPYFSIVIPSFNRAKQVRRAVISALCQKFDNFEIIVSDNHSQDNTKEVMEKISDQRVRYFRNNRNIGWIPNLQRAISYSKGKYILLHGDDDFILWEDFLQRLYQLLQKQPVGFIRLNYLSYSDDQNIIFDFHNRQFKHKTIDSRIKGKQLVEFIDAKDPFFITGITLEGDILRKIPLVQSEFAPWIPAVYQAIKSNGGLVWPEYEFIATWSKNAAYPRYYLANGKYRFERYFEEVKKHVSEDYYQKFLHKRLNILIEEFPAGKFFTSNSNFFRYALHLLDLDSTFRFSLKYWFWIVFSLLTPKTVLKLLRKRLVETRQDRSIPNLDAIYKRIAFLGKVSDDKA